MAVVVLDVDKLRASNPCLSDEVTYPDELLEVYFHYAEELIGNSEKGWNLAPYNPNRGITIRETLLYLVACHLAYMQNKGSTGSVASSTQGSVSISFNSITWDSPNAQWWNLSPCGALFWLLTAKYRQGGRLYTSQSKHPWG